MPQDLQLSRPGAESGQERFPYRHRGAERVALGASPTDH